MYIIPYYITLGSSKGQALTHDYQGEYDIHDNYYRQALQAKVIAWHNASSIVEDGPDMPYYMTCTV